METLIDITTLPDNIIKLLLKDKTTKKNIIWATNNYIAYGEKYQKTEPITLESLSAFSRLELQPRILKNEDLKQERTKSHAEVFTPSWICNKMNNHCDTGWFERENVFNIEKENKWETIEAKIIFPENKTWKDYIDSRRLEITCGEAPYLVSRYDASTGKMISINHRIGILDRKIRVINENTETESEWLEWVYRAFQSVYGYEYQGDSLLIGRINLIMTFIEYLLVIWKRQPTLQELKKIANIISWNLWQMDGLTGTIPFGTVETNQQTSIFEIIAQEKMEKSTEITPRCRIYDWRANRSVYFESLKKGVKE